MGCVSAAHTHPDPAGQTDVLPQTCSGASPGTRGCGTLLMAQCKTPRKAPKEFVYSQRTGLLLGSSFRPPLLRGVKSYFLFFQPACSHSQRTPLRSRAKAFSSSSPAGRSRDASAHHSPCAALSFCFARLRTPISSGLFCVRRA